MSIDICFWHVTPYSYGGTTLFGPSNDRLKIELDSDGYGSAIQDLLLVVALPEQLGKLTKKEKQKFGSRPKKRFTRKSGKMRIEWLSERCTAYDEEEPKMKHFNLAAQDVIDALSLIRETLKPTDDFDIDRFERDVNESLSKKFKSQKEIDDLDARTREGLDEEFDEWFANEMKNPNPTSPIETYEIIWPHGDPEPDDFDFVEFRNETCCVSQWYYSILGRKLLGSTPRLFVQLEQSLAEPELRSTAALVCPFDFDTYFDAEITDRKALVARTLRDGLIHFASLMGKQDTQPIEDAFAKMEAAEFCFVGELNRRYSGTRLTARIKFEYDIDGMEVVVAFTKKGGRAQLAERELGLVPPHPWLLNTLPACCRWNGAKFQIDMPGFKRNVQTRDIK